MRRVLIVVVAGAALAIAGCGSDDEDDQGAASEKQETTVEISGGDVVKVAMKNTAFDPASTTAKVGQTVEWTNDDSFDHNVTATAGEDFKSKNFGQGGKYAYKLDEAGTIKYTCTLHPGMDGTIEVTQ
jgi:plastocyanin